MKTVLVNMITAAVLVFAASASAGELADAGQAADSQVGQGNYREALATLAAAEDKIWQKTPPFFTKAVFVAADPEGFGIYDLHEGNTFKGSEPLILYAEPVGYGYRKDGEMNIIDLSLDFEVKSKDGRLIGGREGFASPRLRSRVQNREFFIKVVYDFSKVPAGEYEVKTTVNDKTSGKSGSFILPFSLTQ